MLVHHQRDLLAGLLLVGSVTAGFSAGQQVPLKPPLSLAWKARVGQVETAPAVHEGQAVILTGEFGSSRLSFIEIASGKMLKSGKPHTFWLPGISSPVFHNGQVYFGITTHGRQNLPGLERGLARYTFGAEPTEGSIPLVFKIPDNWPVYGKPGIYNDKLYFMAGDFAVYCVGLDGKQLWRYQTRRPVGHDHRPFGQPDSVVESSPAIVEGVVYIGSRDGSVYALDAETGTLKWRFETAGPVDSSPALAEKTLFIGSRDGNLYCLDKASGKKRWAVKTGGWVSSSPVVDRERNRVYVGSYDGHVYGVNAKNGKTAWKFKTDGWVLSSPLLANGVVYAGSFDQHLYALDAADGKELWKYKTGNAVVAAPVAAGDRLLIGSCDNYLYCFGPAGTKCVASADVAPAVKEHALTPYLEKLKTMDAFEIAEIMGAYLEKSGYYPKPNAELPDDYAHRKRLVETLVYRGQEALVDGEWAAHDLKVALLNERQEGDPELGKIQEQFQKGRAAYLKLWEEYRGLLKAEAKQPAEVVKALQSLETHLPAAIQEMQVAENQALSKLKPLVKEVQVKGDKGKKFYYCTQVGVDGSTAGLLPKIQVPEWEVFISGITAKFGVEAHRSGWNSDRTFKYTGVGYNFEPNHPGWCKGLFADGRSPDELALNVKKKELNPPEPDYMEGSWFADEGMLQRYQESIAKKAMNLRNDPAFYNYNLGNEIHFQAHTAITGYGPWPEYCFQQWLKQKYGVIGKLNETWGVKLKSFEEVKLPLQLAETPAEHALWEDWGLAREQAITAFQRSYYQGANSVDKAHPVIDRYLVYSHDAWLSICGWNYYQQAKTVDYAGSHVWYNLLWLMFANEKRYYCSEWTPFFARGMSLDNVQKKVRRLINDWCALGQSGWEIFCWIDLVTYGHTDAGIGFYGPFRGFLRYDGLPNALAFEMRQFINRARKFEAPIAGGAETRLPVALLWSQANFRHDFKRISYNDGAGWHYMLNSLHAGADIIFDDEFLEKKMDLSPYAVVIVPWLEYLDEAVSQALIAYAQNGGKLLVTGSGASYNRYGRKNLLLAKAAGVEPVSEAVSDETVNIAYQGDNVPMFVSRGNIKIGKLYRYEIASGRPVQVAGQWNDKPAIVRAPVGKGEILFIGAPIGFQHVHHPGGQIDGNPIPSPTTEKLLAKIFAEWRLPYAFQSESPLITARFWKYQDDEYLFLVNNNTQNTLIKFTVANAKGLTDVLTGQNVRMDKNGPGASEFTADLLYGEGRVFLVNQ